MIVSHIVARSENNAIGFKGQIPWKISADLKYFKSVTTGHHVIMGRKTYESIGKPLPGRMNIIISSKLKLDEENVKTFDDVIAALAYCREHPFQNKNEIFVIGGGQIYEATASIAEKIYLTEVHATIKGDTFYEIPDEETFREVSRQDHEGDPSYSFVVLEK